MKHGQLRQITSKEIFHQRVGEKPATRNIQHAQTNNILRNGLVVDIENRRKAPNVRESASTTWALFRLLVRCAAIAHFKHLKAGTSIVEHFQRILRHELTAIVSKQRGEAYSPLGERAQPTLEFGTTRHVDTHEVGAASDNLGQSHRRELCANKRQIAQSATVLNVAQASVGHAASVSKRNGCEVLGAL